MRVAKKKRVTLEDVEDLSIIDIAASIKDAAAKNKKKKKKAEKKEAKPEEHKTTEKK